MAIDNIKQYFARQYEEFEPFWAWKGPVVEKKTKGHEKEQYNEILNACRMSQYPLAGLAILLALSFQSSRSILASAATRDGVLLILMELASYIFLGYFMGLKRFPANYISLVIIKSFVVLERKFRPQVDNFSVKVLKESRFHGQWSLLSYNPNPDISVSPVESQIRNVSLMFIMMGMVWGISKFSNIDLTRYEKCNLIVTTFASSTAALLLVTTFAFEAIPEIKPFHRKCCELWILVAVSTFIFTLTFLLQRLRLLLSRRLRASQNIRVQWECVLYMMAMYITIRYIPVIHKGTSTREILETKLNRLIQVLVPEVVLKSVDILSKYCMAVGEKLATIQAGML